MTEEITTIKVLRKDRVWLENLFGQPTHIAFHKVRDLCPHPEKPRIYTTALIRIDGDRALNMNEGNTRQITGFLCGTCHKYIFPDPETK